MDESDIAEVDIGMRLSAARQAHRWTQVQLASRAGVGLATIRRIEQTGMEPRIGTLRRLASTLGVRMAWLIDGEEPIYERNRKA